METFTLNDGVVIPSVGFGVFMIPVGDETYNAVGTATATSTPQLLTSTKQT